MSNRKSKADELLLRLLKRDGWWACKDCATENWVMYHKKEELSCPKTGKPREECEINHVAS